MGHYDLYHIGSFLFTKWEWGSMHYVVLIKYKYTLQKTGGIVYDKRYF